MLRGMHLVWENRLRGEGAVKKFFVIYERPLIDEFLKESLESLQGIFLTNIFKHFKKETQKNLQKLVASGF